MEENKEPEATQETGVATTQPEAPVVKKIPKFSDLIKEDKVEEVWERDTLNWLLNQAPPDKWIKKHPLAKKEITREDTGEKIKVPIDYLPIEKVEFLLTRIFQQWKTEILTVGSLFQSVYCTVRLHYKDPLTGDWLYQDGAGAVDVQTAKGKSASSLEFIIPGAIQKGLPAAETYAIKDAAEKIGKIFGKDLNRADAIAFTMGYNTGERTLAEKLEEKPDATNIPQDIIDSIAAATDRKVAHNYWALHPELHEFPEYKEIIQNRIAEIDLAKKAEEVKSGNNGDK